MPLKPGEALEVIGKVRHADLDAGSGDADGAHDKPQAVLLPGEHVFDRGGERTTMMYSFFGTARLNDVYPLVWFTNVLARIADIPQIQLHELLPWNWKAAQTAPVTELAA